MGIKCSLFGHDFGETTVERDREEQGNEVVSTIREIETCSRCGETRIVSENTEVTTIKTPAEVSVPDETEAEPADSESQAEAEIVDAEEDEPVADIDSTTSEPSDEVEEFESAAEDDGVILEDDSGEQLARDPGEWPESDSTDESAPVDTGAPAQTVSEVDENEPDGQQDHAADVIGEESTATADDQAEVWSGTDPDLERTESDVQQTESGTDAVTDGKFRCSECGFTTAINSSSLREGDYCPECHQGMLVVETQ